MPYTLFQKEEKGEKKYCMKSKETGKTYCFDSPEKRKKGMRMHEVFKHIKKGSEYKSF
jgi:hypothetical protein